MFSWKKIVAKDVLVTGWVQCGAEMWPHEMWHETRTHCTGFETSSCVSPL